MLIAIIQVIKNQDWISNTLVIIEVYLHLDNLLHFSFPRYYNWKFSKQLSKNLFFTWWNTQELTKCQNLTMSNYNLKITFVVYSEPKKCPNDLLILKDWFISQELLIGIKWFMYHWKGLHHSFPKQVTLLHNIA